MQTTPSPAKSDKSETATRPAQALAWAPLLWIAAAAFAVEIPFFFRGIPSGHDIDFHMYSWLEVLSQWKHGIVYPRWAALAHFAYGEPRFIFYPPASWTLGGLLSAVFPWTLVVPVYIWIVLVAAGAAMFLLARQWLDRRDAMFAAVLYAVNPYHLVIVYWRSAMAELMAAFLLPLMLLLVLRAEEKGQRVMVGLAAVLAAAWLINAPAAVMIHYSMALLLAGIAWQRKAPRVLLVGAGAVALGAALAGFYLLPAVYEQRWINIAQAVSAGSRPLDNFIFVRTDDAEHDAFNRVISWIVVAEVVATMAAAWLARRRSGRERGLCLLLTVWGALCAFLMVPISNVLWNILPKLRFMQFPWRWTLCLGVPLTLLVVMGVRRWTWRAAIYAAMIFVLAFTWRHYQAPWWDDTGDLNQMQDNMSSGGGYEGTDEYAPAGTLTGSGDSMDKEARRVRVDGSARAAIRVLQWDAEHKVFTAEMSAADRVALRLLNYPAWRVEVNGGVVRTGTREETGQMLVPVEAGANRVEIVFVRTWDRNLGAWISAAAGLCGLGLVWKSRRIVLNS